MTGAAKRIAHRLLPVLTGRLLPLLCPLCKKGLPFDGSPNMFCADCLNTLPNIAGTPCRICGGNTDTILGVCTDCLKEPRRPWTHAYALFRYGRETAQCIHPFKYSGHTEFAAAFGRLAAGKLSGRTGDYDLITAVPLHWRRYLKRGYNQSVLFAEEVARETGIPYRKLLSRNRWTDPQAFLPGEERISNIQGAFSVLHSTEVEKRGILLVDDVMTTGSTLAEAAETLRTAGAKQVDVLVIARRQRN